MIVIFTSFAIFDNSAIFNYLDYCEKMITKKYFLAKCFLCFGIFEVILLFGLVGM